MLTEPQNAYSQVDGVTAIACRAIDRARYQSLYRSADGNTEISVSSLETKSGRVRHTIKTTAFKNILDPLVSSTVYKRVSMSTSMVIDRPVGSSFSLTDVINSAAGLKLQITTALATALYSYES